MSQAMNGRPLAPYSAGDGKSRRSSDASNSSPLSKARIHSACEWESMHSIVKQLYVTEHRKLSEVMFIMDRHYGFKATEQMYKKRFTAWGLAKNRKRSNSKTPSLGDKPHAGSSITEARSPGAKFVLRKNDMGYSPAENAVRSIAVWVGGSFDSIQWLQSNQRLGVSSANAPTSYPSTRMYQDMALSYALLDRRQGYLAGLAVRKAFWRIEKVITVGDPGIMRNLVDIITQMLKLKQSQLLRMLLSQLANLATHRLPKLHPLSQFFHSLSKANTDFPAVLKTSYHCFVEKFHGGMSDEFYWMYDNWAWDTSNRPMDTDPEADYKRTTEALTILALAESTGAADGSNSHLQMLKSNSALMKSEGFKKTSAAGILAKMKGQPSSNDVFGDPKVRTYMQTAIIRQAIDQKDWSTAREIMLGNVQMMEIQYGRNSREIIRELWSLEKVTRKAGNDEEADSLAEDALNRVNTYLSEVPGFV
ncbi:Clr5 domain-containing protein [Truncatella angustata]|uniref:Clr5 domain-containing protein n=1 Tax=Truncatella angustata TaxID=152316 RepID=A0A9P8UHC5_9PEZI|nr:Clr5 domain-containing protein [Truncatella angustata]KAH6652387.1 Clr5 domain-containing protein [Truncatella angustata]